MDQDRRVARRELAEPVLELVERDEPRPGNVAARVLLARPHVDDDERRAPVVEGERLSRLDVTVRDAAEDGVSLRGLTRRHRRQVSARHGERSPALVAELLELAPEETHLAKLSLGNAEAAREPPGRDDKPQRDGADQEDHPRRPPVRGRRSAVKRARGSR